MNATLQCLVNINELTKYLLIPENFSTIIKQANNCEILSCYCLLLEKLCCDENIKNKASGMIQGPFIMFRTCHNPGTKEPEAGCY